jgi:hypothetical protein
MKRSVYIAGISSILLMLFGCIAKIMHWPGASPTIIIAVFLFCFWFLPTGLINSYNSLPLKKMKTLHIVSFFVFFISMMGILFKIMHWPGANLFVLPSLLLPFVIFLPVYLYHTRDEEKTGNKNFFGLTLGLTFLAVFSVFLVMGTSRTLLHWAADNTALNDAFSRSYPVTPVSESEISRSANELYTYADELKCALISESDPEMCTGTKTNANYSVETISSPDWVKTTFSSEEGAQKVLLLKEKINAFRETILSAKTTSPELAELTKLLFDTGDSDENGINIPGEWQRREMDDYPLLFTLDFLSKLQSNVRLVEGEALK